MQPAVSIATLHRSRHRCDLNRLGRMSDDSRILNLLSNMQRFDASDLHLKIVRPRPFEWLQASIEPMLRHLQSRKLSCCCNPLCQNDCGNNWNEKVESIFSYLFKDERFRCSVFHAGVDCMLPFGGSTLESLASRRFIYRRCTSKSLLACRMV